MKNYLLTACFLCFTFVLNAQNNRILFDATKAETAGNADWIIDADSHNLGYDSGPAGVGQGNESNAQRIPTPDQSGITQSTPEDYWNGALSYWGIDLVKKGYKVETLPYNGSITYNNSSNAQDLKNYKVFIVCEPNIVFSTAEKTAIIQFVQHGGGLFVVSDHDNSDRNNDGWDSPHIWNDLMDNNSIQNDPFGFTFDYVSFSQTTTNVANLPNDPLLHGIMGNVTKAMWSAGTSMTLNPTSNTSVKGVIYKTGSSIGNNNAMVAYATYGQGKVVGIGDSSPCDDGSGDSNDQLYDGWISDAGGNHEKLIINACIWLATDSSVGVPETAESGNPYKIASNPVKDYLVIEPSGLSNGLTDIMIIDLSGKKILERKFESNETFCLPVGSFAPGCYLYRIKDNSQKIFSGKFIKL
ncbi:MAG: T9SS type A sorting domain-containing protein [Bacteroidetes bacterium]|nr:T9SS type A sorting domain-containing protein [Bacteroidota bacterium]